MPPAEQPDCSLRTQRTYHRQVMRIFTLLFITSMLSAALWPVPPLLTSLAEARIPGGGDPLPSTPPTASPPIPSPPPPLQPQTGGELTTHTDAPTAAPIQRAPDLPEEEPSRLVVNGDPSCPQIALTYDAGSGADGATAILEMLQRHRLKSTFFLTGKWVERYPELAKRIADDGHEIANHTYSHPDLTKLSPAEVMKQVADGEAAIKAVTGKDARPLFREPYGAFNEAERRLVRQAGYSYSIYWDVDTLDWQFPGVATLTRRILEKSKNGSIVLMHLNVPETAIASDQAIPVLKERGFTLVTVSQVLACP